MAVIQHRNPERVRRSRPPHGSPLRGLWGSSSASSPSRGSGRSSFLGSRRRARTATTSARRTDASRCSSTQTRTLASRFDARRPWSSCSRAVSRRRPTCSTSTAWATAATGVRKLGLRRRQLLPTHRWIPPSGAGTRGATCPHASSAPTGAARGTSRTATAARGARRACSASSIHHHVLGHATHEPARDWLPCRLQQRLSRGLHR
mmetsp:Transcript_117212/g.311771  ORF Transcript_117212/g.311771 Transcript_117212/m.311771 type:complete len:205 (+) Transcript_117212:746-1360(+)